nr:FAD-binding oxidoreductase [Rhodospirillales bacterium]
MAQPLETIVTDEKLPPRTDVVVIGGGVVGVGAALTLARQGVSVLLCEKGRLAGEQSSRNWGWVRKTNRDLREVPLIIESLRLWNEMTREGIDTGYRECGILYIDQNDADRERHERWLALVEPFQIGSRIIEGEALAEKLPGATRRFKSAIYTPTDGRAEPQKAVTAMAAAARTAGAVIVQNCAVRGLDLRAGRVAGVVTEHGRVACDSAILAGGAWSRLFCGSLGLRLPQLKVRATVLRTAPIENGPETSAWLGDFSYRKRQDGGYTIANGRGNVVPLVPDSFRFFREFLPAMRAERRGIRLRLTERFFKEAMTP